MNKVFEYSNKYYNELSVTEYNKEFSYLTNFNRFDYDLLEKTAKSLDFTIEYGYYNTHCFQTERGLVNRAPQVIVKGDKEYFVISMKSDEWFLVEKCRSDEYIYSNRIGKYYKCDQIEGVIKLISEVMVNESSDIKKFDEFNKLIIFDFDETLVLNPRFEELAIEFLKEDVTIKSLLSSSIRKIGVNLSDLKWENGKIFVNDIEKKIDVKSNWVRKGNRVYLIPPDKFYFTDMSLPINVTNLAELYNSVENKAIVTGRSNDIRDKVLESLKKFNLDIPNHGLFCYPSKPTSRDVKSEKVAEWKANTIVKLIKDTKFDDVHFYDDNSKWVNKVTSVVKKELPNIKWGATKYKHKNG